MQLWHFAALLAVLGIAYLVISSVSRSQSNAANAAAINNRRLMTGANAVNQGIQAAGNFLGGLLNKIGADSGNVQSVNFDGQTFKTYTDSSGYTYSAQAQARDYAADSANIAASDHALDELEKNSFAADDNHVFPS